MKRKKIFVVLVLFLFVMLPTGCIKNEKADAERQDITDVKENSEVQSQPEQSHETEAVADDTEEMEGAEEVETTEEIEATEEIEETNDWSKVGIVDGKGIIYNGDVIELVVAEDNDSYMSGYYTFENPADFMPLAEADINYYDTNIRLWASEHMRPRLRISGNYELEKVGEFNDTGRDYDLIVNGECIGNFGVEEPIDQTSVIECAADLFSLYPVKNLKLNGFQFDDAQMSSVVNYFGDPCVVSYTLSDGESYILYMYRQEQVRWKNTDMGNVVTVHASTYIFHTTDGKNIESIEISLPLTKEEIQAEQ
mgnify:CR=1 FL=1